MQWAVASGQWSVGRTLGARWPLVTGHCPLQSSLAMSEKNRGRIWIMKTITTMGAVLFLAMVAPSRAQVFTFTREQMIKYTAKNPFDRFADGRPKIPEALLENVKGLSSEKVSAVLPGAKFPNQYEGNWQLLHPGRKLVGRAVTAQFMPYRPDVAEVSEAEVKARGLGQNANQRVIDMLQPND